MGFEGFKAPKKESGDPVPEMESTLQELEIRKKQLPEEGRRPGEYTPAEEQDLKNTLNSLLEK